MHRSPAADVYFALKDLVNNEDAIEHLKRLYTFSKYYEKLINPEKETDCKVRHAIQKIRRTEITTAYPFFLNCFSDYEQKKISSEEFVEIIKIIENYIIRRFVCNVATNQLNKIFPSLYNLIQTKNPKNFVEGLRQNLQYKGYPKDTAFRESLKNTKLYGSGDRAIKAKLILETIEESYHHKEKVDYNQLSIEHIMPQTLTKQWQEHIGNGWEITHELLLHTIGNLTLTGYNPELSNDSFFDKKNKLVQSHLEINKYFQDKNAWRKEDIEERSAHLADIIINEWPFFGEDNITGDQPADVTGTIPTALWILGQSFKVGSWRDVLELTLETINELEPDKFALLVQHFPHFINKDKKKFRAIRELKNGYLIDVNLSAKVLHRFCLQALDVSELTADDWKVEFT